MKIFDKNDFSKKDIVFIVPHHFSSLKYYDKLYWLLIKENIEPIYIFKNNKNMEEFCKQNNRKYLILNFPEPIKFKQLLDPFLKYLFKKKVEKIIENFEPKLIILAHGLSKYYDLVIKASKRFHILSITLQWAVYTPERFDFKNRELENLKIIRKMNLYEIIKFNFFNKLFKTIYFPLYHFFRIYSNFKISLGQEDSDFVGVINTYTKNLLIEQGVNSKKIKILGSLNYDDAINAKNRPIDYLKVKYGIKSSEKCIVFFSQPFYTKDIKKIKLEDHLIYVKKLISTIDKFYNNINKKYKLLIKLHPFEDVNNFKELYNQKNIEIIINADINDLILLSDVCISQNSTVLLSVITMKKAVISLNILNLPEIEIGAKVMGINKCVESWNEFIKNFEELEKKKYSELNNINYDYIILDGKCYERTIKIIKNLVKITKKRVYYIN